MSACEERRHHVNGDLDEAIAALTRLRDAVRSVAPEGRDIAVEVDATCLVRLYEFGLGDRIDALVPGLDPS